MIEDDLVEAVIGLGPNLFYNSPMEACLLITKANKEESKKNKILFINAVKEARQDKNIGYLDQAHIDKIFNAYSKFENEENFAVLVDKQEVLGKKANMAINLYIRPDSLVNSEEASFTAAHKDWQQSSDSLEQSMEKLFEEFVSC
jgi:type I restriction enzyme M protein